MLLDITDSPGWAEKKQLYPDFFADPRNIVLMACADGVNPWKKKGAGSFLLIVLAVLNLPSDIRMKRENLMLLGMTDKKPKDVHLVYELVVDQLVELWHGVAAWDSTRDEHFNLRAMMALGLFDYPGLCEACGQPNEGSISGCCKCTLQGVNIKEFKHVKYSQHLHDMRDGHDIPVERHTHAGLLARGNHIEVRTRFRPSTSRFLAVRVSKLSM